MSDFLSQFPSGNCEPILNKYPGEEVRTIEDCNRGTAFDASSTSRGGGAVVVLYGSDGTNVSVAFKLGFPCLTMPSIKP